MIIALLLSLVPQASAADKQYRRVTLTDGRVLVGEVVATEAAGLLLHSPQGELLVSFEVLADMTPIDGAMYEAQGPWVVYLAPSVFSDALTEHFDEIPGLKLLHVGETGAGITHEQATAAGACDDDLDCIASATSEAQWLWVVGAQQSSAGGPSLVARLNTGDTRLKAEANTTSPPDLWAATHAVLGLNPPADLPESLARAVSKTGMTESQIVRSSFVPIPGLPSLKQGDGGGFGLSLAVVVPTTALWVGAVGKNAQSAPELIGLGALGFYATTVLTNQVMGMRSYNAALAVSPLESGGATVQVTTRR